MWFFWVFGNNIEVSMEPRCFLAFITGMLLIRRFTDPAMMERRRRVHAEPYPELSTD